MALAPPFMPKPGPAGPASPPTGNPGLMAAASAQVREGLNILEKALPNLQAGSDEYNAVLESIRKLSKAFPATAAMPGIQTSTLLSMLRDAKQGAPMKAMQAGMKPPGGAAPPAGGGMQQPGGGLAALMGGGSPMAASPDM